MSILIRSASGFDENKAAVKLQIETWGYEPQDVIVARMFTIAQRIGGQVIAAFDTDIAGSSEDGSPDNMIGFAMALPAVLKRKNCPPGVYLHSHMLAVRGGYRDQGLGVRLKHAQRLEALSRGITKMEWTFDPLETKNAYLNLHRLGAVVRSYTPNFYGVSSSKLQAGLPTDRLHAEWFMDWDRVESRLTNPAAAIPSESVIERVLIPASVRQWKSEPENIHLALELQSQVRQRLQAAFADGLTIIGFSRDESGNGTYELGVLSLPE